GGWCLQTVRQRRPILWLGRVGSGLACARGRPLGEGRPDRTLVVETRDRRVRRRLYGVVASLCPPVRRWMGRLQKITELARSLAHPDKERGAISPRRRGRPVVAVW